MKSDGLIFKSGSQLTMNEQFEELVNTLATEAPLCRAWLEIVARRAQCSGLPRLIRKRDPPLPPSPEALHHFSYLCSTVPVPRCTAVGRGGKTERLQSRLESLMSSSDRRTKTSTTLVFTAKWTKVALRDSSQQLLRQQPLHLTSCCSSRGF